jgi:hypothetical protein
MLDSNLLSSEFWTKRDHRIFQITQNISRRKADYMLEKDTPLWIPADITIENMYLRPFRIYFGRVRQWQGRKESCEKGATHFRRATPTFTSAGICSYKYTRTKTGVYHKQNSCVYSSYRTFGQGCFSVYLAKIRTGSQYFRRGQAMGP